MRIFYRPMIVAAYASAAWATSLAAFVCDVVILVRNCLYDALTWSFDFIPRVAPHQQPKRLISMAATALNERKVGGVTIHGFLGRPTDRMLAG